MIRVRAMTEGDALRVLGVNAAAGSGVASLDAAELARLLALPNEHRVAIAGEDAAFGYALAFPREAAYDGEEFRALRSAIAAPFIYIDQVAVAAAHHRRGLGRALYQALERIAARHRIRILCCEVNTRPPNPASLAFHARMGFDAFGTLTVSDGREVRLLTRTLPDPEGA
ncbi:MAG: GNAT family N-acetyltransferase [Proteobacteria bacterium]|nr:GNAT family N-acetyltransferase [Pseudomonadota bacterium]